MWTEKLRKPLKFFIYLCLLLTLGCATATTNTEPPQTQLAAAQPTAVRVDLDTLGVGDIFEVNVYDEKELSGSYRVASDGTIDFPLAGRIEVEGLSSTGLAETLRLKLLAFMTAPQVSVFVKVFKSKKIYVFGEVRKPGTFPFEDGMTIVQAITLAGGFDKLADQNGTFINRVINGSETKIEVSVKDIGKGRAPNLQLKPGDIVYIPESMF
jgi:protein involved in polysaccharide export with SLBB domain